MQAKFGIIPGQELKHNIRWNAGHPKYPKAQAKKESTQTMLYAQTY